MAQSQKKLTHFFRPVTIILLALLFISSIIAILHSRKDQQRIQITPTNPVGEIIQTEQIKSIFFYFNQGEDNLLITKNATGDWHFTDKPDLIASVKTVDAIINQIASLQIVRELDIAETLDPYGLAIPIAWIILTYQDGTEYVLEIGEPTPVESGYYVKLNSPQISIADYDQIVNLLNLFYFGILPTSLSNNNNLLLTPNGP